MEVQYIVSLFDIEILLITALGVLAGIAIGILPGLSATLGVSLLLPVTFGMDTIPGLLLLVGIYFGAIYGGSVTAILLRTPGTPAAAATAIEGYALTQKGYGLKAMKVATLSSTMGGLISVIILILLAPVLARVALEFGPPEYFALTFFGLSIISFLLGRSVIKGLTATFLGLLIASIGMDPIGAFPRFTFGSPNLRSGVEFISALIGLFAASQAFHLMENVSIKNKVLRAMENTRLRWNEIKRILPTIFLSSGIGTIFGTMPGAGAETAAFIAYNETKRFSKNKEGFGQGRIEGVAAPEAANNGTTGGAFIPLLSLGIPGDAVTAIMLGALIIQGLQPGPLLFQNHPDLVSVLFLGMLLSYILMFIFAWYGLRLFTKILYVPKNILIPVILVLSVIGTYAIGNNFFNVWVMFLFGVLGYVMMKYDFPLPPVVLALILGPLMEENLRRSLVMTQGSLDFIYTRPITLVLILIALLTFLTPLISSFRKKIT